MDNRIFSLFYLSDKNQVLMCSNPIEAIIYYRDFKLDLLTGSKTKSGYQDLHSYLEKIKIDVDYENPVVCHLFYEFGLSCLQHYEKLPGHKPLGIFIKYGEVSESRVNTPLEASKEEFQLEVTEYPAFEEYHQKFEKVYQHLVNGDCYQVNLTNPFYFKFKGIDDPLRFVHQVWSRTLGVGEYAHATYIDSLGKLYLSNSPECLFKIKKEKKDFNIYSMPIKGTVRVEEEEGRAKANSRDIAWEKLINSKKDQAELYMISDLLRNDLTRISFSPAKILDKKLPLHVPGLVHQYSKIKAQLNNKTNLNQILLALYPGGSITGAPKKRVAEIIHEIEDYTRGFYCGSTVIFYKSLKAASINIRSAVFDLSQNELFYGAGGGITLLSQSKEEFDETYAKMESFLHFLKVKNINKS